MMILVENPENITKLIPAPNGKIKLQGKFITRCNRRIMGKIKRGTLFLGRRGRSEK